MSGCDSSRTTTLEIRDPAMCSDSASSGVTSPRSTETASVGMPPQPSFQALTSSDSTHRPSSISQAETCSSGSSTSRSDEDETETMPPGFEGPEKTLELDFSPGIGSSKGALNIPRSEWDSILQEARCTILASEANDKFVSYVLSESSLFVYPDKILLKTCGTTTLLRALEPILTQTRALGMRLEWVAYSRKDYMYPTYQKYPHRSFDEELSFLKERFPSGSGYVLGPLTSDHWVVFVADFCERPSSDCRDRTLNVMMYGIHPSRAALFEQSKRTPTAEAVTRGAGIDQLIPGSRIQAWLFEPCGYSMNGMLFEAYWTIHVTPESHCSYASFETNIKSADYSALLNAVLRIFRPARFTATLFADEHGLDDLKRMPFTTSIVPIPSLGYTLGCKSSTEFMGDYVSHVANYVKQSRRVPSTRHPDVPAASHARVDDDPPTQTCHRASPNGARGTGAAAERVTLPTEKHQLRPRLCSM